MAPTVANVSVYMTMHDYDRETLFETGKWPHGINLDLLELDYLLHYNSFRRGLPAAGPSVCNRRKKRPKWQRRERWATWLHARLKASRPPLPSLLVANVWSLEDKMDEQRTRIISQREVKHCCALIFTETWLADNILESAVSCCQLQNTHSHSPHGIIWEAKICIFFNIFYFFFIYCFFIWQ